MMLAKDGFAVAKKIRQKNDLIPIIYLSAKSQDQDKIEGFKTGADDYITKSFNMKELLLRMEVFLRCTKKCMLINFRNIHLENFVFLLQI